MKKLNILFLFLLLILVSNFSFCQDVEEMQLFEDVQLEAISLPTYPDSITTQFLVDHNGKFISNAYPIISNSKKKLILDVKGKKLIIDLFIRAIVNFETKRIYALDPTPYEGSSRPYNGIRIYDLEGNELKNYLEYPTQTFDPWFVVSKTGNLFTISKMPSDSLFLIRLDSSGNQIWKTYFSKKDTRHYNFLPKISSNGNIAFMEVVPQSSSKILVFDGNNGKMIFNKDLHHRSKIILFNDNDLICESGFTTLHYSISENIFTQRIFKTVLFISFLPTMDSSNQYFGICCKDLEGRKNEYLFLLFKKESDDFILNKKISLSNYIALNDESKDYPPPEVNKVLINENGVVSLFYRNNKLLKFK